MADFDAAAATYDRSRHEMIPDYDVLYGTAVSALPNSADAAISVLDLGSGTGGFAGEVVNAFARARLVLSDVSGEMLDKAREKFGGDDRFSFVQADCLAGGYGGPYDAVVSSLMIHHLEHDDKRRVFTLVHEALKPGGVFVNIDQFKARSPRIDRQLFDRWLQDVRAAGVPEADIAAGCERMEAYDRNAAMNDQFAWLEHAGFCDVDIIYRNYFWAVFVATKAG
jgi:tRNA (cmo5U34)-methyltransferase